MASTIPFGPSVIFLVCHMIYINTAVRAERKFRTDVIGLCWLGMWSQVLPRPSRLPLPSRACDGALRCPARPPLPPRPLGTPEAGVPLRILSATHTATSPEATAPSSQGQASSTGEPLAADTHTGRGGCPQPTEGA